MRRPSAHGFGGSLHAVAGTLALFPSVTSSPEAPIFAAKFILHSASSGAQPLCQSCLSSNCIEVQRVKGCKGLHARVFNRFYFCFSTPSSALYRSIVTF